MCQVEKQKVIAVHNVSSTYHVPLLLSKQKIVETLSNLLRLPEIVRPAELIEKGTEMWKTWTNLTKGQEHAHDTVTIALVGKYTSLPDAYTSVTKALEHSAMFCRKKLELVWVDSEDLEDEMKGNSPAKFHKAWHAVCTANAILVPGGFGLRGTGGMIKAINWARTNKIPYLGICLGMQLAVIEYASNVAGIEDAGSEELNPDAKNHVIIYMPEVSRTLIFCCGTFADKTTGGQDKDGRNNAAGKAPLHLPEGHRVVQVEGAVRGRAADRGAPQTQIRGQPGDDRPVGERGAHIRGKGHQGGAHGDHRAPRSPLVRWCAGTPRVPQPRSVAQQILPRVLRRGRGMSRGRDGGSEHRAFGLVSIDSGIFDAWRSINGWRWMHGLWRKPFYSRIIHRPGFSWPNRRVDTLLESSIDALPMNKAHFCLCDALGTSVCSFVQATDA